MKNVLNFTRITQEALGTIENNLTIQCSPTLYALSICMNGRAAHFIMQTAIAYSAADWGVGMIPFVNRGDRKSANRS